MYASFLWHHSACTIDTRKAAGRYNLRTLQGALAGLLHFDPPLLLLCAAHCLRMRRAARLCALVLLVIEAPEIEVRLRLAVFLTATVRFEGVPVTYRFGGDAPLSASLRESMSAQRQHLVASAPIQRRAAIVTATLYTWRLRCLARSWSGQHARLPAVEVPGSDMDAPMHTGVRAEPRSAETRRHSALGERPIGRPLQSYRRAGDEAFRLANVCDP